MQDPRIRLLAVIILSIASFLSVGGALLAGAWWLFCTNRKTAIHSIRGLLMLLMLPAVAAFLVGISGGDYFGYFIRITVILLIASWAYADRQAGELLDISVWLLGKGIGFDLGLVAELSISALEVLSDDIRRVGIALVQKGSKLDIQTLTPVISSLLVRQLMLARDRAVILAIRGYQAGGTLAPVFSPSGRDIVSGVLSLIIFVISPNAGEFFIALLQIVIV